VRFLLDVMLGKLATYLRMCGHDAAYALERAGDGDAGSQRDASGIEDDDALLSLARREDRQLVTRDADLAARTRDAILLSGTNVDDQLRELHAAGVDLALSRPERCSHCNGQLERVDGGETPPDAPDPGEQRVWRCRRCGHHYWKGSHWADVRERLEAIREDGDVPGGVDI
jgi:uncharacterized protein with PIN domain